MTPEDAAKAVHAHAVRQVRRAGGWTTGTLVASSAGPPPTVSITLAGSSTQIDGVAYSDQFKPASYSFSPTVVVLVGAHGDLFVVCAVAGGS
jgi:hypothetical protein